MKSSFINLRVFSHYSRFESILRPKQIISIAHKNEHFAVGICDRMNLFGAVEFSKQAKQLGVKPIIGCLLQIDQMGEIPVFIKNLQGFKFLSELLSKVYINEKTSLNIEELKLQTGLIALSGSIRVPGQLDLLHSIFLKDFYVELNTNDESIIKYAIEKNYSIVFTGEVRYETPSDHETFTVFQGIEKDNSSQNTTKIYDNSFFKNHRDFPEDLKKIQEGFINSVNIAKKCNFIINGVNPMIPKFHETNGEDDIALVKNAIEGLKRKLQTNDIPTVYMDRLNREIDVLQSKGFSGYFLVTADFIGHAKRSNIPVGPGRGSGAGSLVAYALDITDIDPIVYNLIFERFLNPERMSIPDFDVDFCPNGREEVVRYLMNKYGPYNVVNIITFGTLQTRAVLKDVARVFNISYGMINNIIKYIPNNPAKPITLSEALEIVPQLKALEKESKFKTIFMHARKLEGLMRNFSKHAAGVIIMDKPVYNVCPLFREDDLVTQFNLGDSEYVGCVKFDLLGLKTLTIIQKTLELIEKNLNIKIDIRNIDMHDKKTYNLFKSGNLEGVFQFDGSAGIKESLSQLQPDNIEDLIAMNALYRPGPIKKLPNYIKRKNGKEEITYLHPSTIPVLKSTFGIMVYQEQVMDIARICASYSLGEADLLRRAMGKKKPEEMKKQQEIFIERAVKNNISKDIAIKLFEEMNEFSGYGFNKSHSAPYSVIAYRCAYLKANYKKEFLSICMSLDNTDGEKLARYVYSAKDLGVEILPPHINKSQVQFSVEGDSIRYGLQALRNVSEETANIIVNNGPYDSIYDFVWKNRSIINKKTWDSLVSVGAFDCFGIDRWQLIGSLDIIRSKEELPMNITPWTQIYQDQQEFHVLGFYLHSPSMRLNNSLKSMGTVGLDFIGTNSFSVVDILAVKKRRTLKDEIYAFVQVCDGHKMLDVTVFSGLWALHGEILENQSPLVLTISKMQQKYIVKEIRTINEFLKIKHILKLQLTEKSQIISLKKIMEKYEGHSCKLIYYIDNEAIDLDVFVDDSLELRDELYINNITIII